MQEQRKREKRGGKKKEGGGKKEREMPFTPQNHPVYIHNQFPIGCHQKNLFLLFDGCSWSLLQATISSSINLISPVSDQFLICFLHLFLFLICFLHLFLSLHLFLHQYLNYYLVPAFVPASVPCCYTLKHFTLINLLFPLNFHPISPSIFGGANPYINPPTLSQNGQDIRFFPLHSSLPHSTPIPLLGTEEAQQCRK